MRIKRRNIFIVCVSLIMVFSVLLISAPGANADALSDYLATHIIGLWPDERIPVKYTIDNTKRMFTKAEQQAIRNAFKTWQKANSRMEFKEVPYKSQALLADPHLEADPSKVSPVVLVTRKPLKEIPQYYLFDKEQGLGSACPSAQAFPEPWGKDKPMQIIAGNIILVPYPKIKVSDEDRCIPRKWTTATPIEVRGIRIIDQRGIITDPLDLETAMLHEIGHLIGLNHPDVLESPTIMGRVAISKNIHRELYPADIDAILRMYPKTANKPPAAELLGTAKVAKNTHLYSKIASHDITAGKTVYPKGWPIGNKTPLRKGDIVNVSNIYENYAESKYTMKIQTKIGKVGYVLNSDLTELKITSVGDRGEITSLVLSMPYEYEGDTKLVDKNISKYNSFVKKYPNSTYANVALLKIADLHLYTFQDKETNGKKASRVEELQAIYKRLSENIEDAQGKKVAKEIDEFISHNKKRIINTDYEGSESQHLLQMNERLSEFCPKILSEP